MTSSKSPHVSWPEVFLDNRGFVHALVRRMAGPELDADDLSQEVFVVVHRKLGQPLSSARGQIGK